MRSFFRFLPIKKKQDLRFADLGVWLWSCQRRPPSHTCSPHHRYIPRITQNREGEREDQHKAHRTRRCWRVKRTCYCLFQGQLVKGRNTLVLLAPFFMMQSYAAITSPPMDKSISLGSFCKILINRGLFQIFFWRSLFLFTLHQRQGRNTIRN